MQDNEIISKMNRQIGISLEAVQWFVLSTFLKSIVTDPEKVKVCFSSAEDCQAIEALLQRINKQFAPNIDKLIETSEERLHLENLIQLPPDNVLTLKTKNIIV